MSEATSSARLWSISAAAVFLEHLLRSGGARPAKFGLKTLCQWAFALLDGAWDPILGELKSCHVFLRPFPGGEADQIFHLLRAAPGETEKELSRNEMEQLLGQITKPLEAMSIEWLPMLRQIIDQIADVLLENLSADLPPTMNKLKEIQVQHAAMFGEDWSVPYEVCWQADGAALSIVLPDIPNFGERHFDHFKSKLEHQSHGQTILYQFLGLWIIPCHEVLHIVQHLRGDLIDPDPRSYAMEHDASRLNFVLLWQVLKAAADKAPWPRYWPRALMLEGVNRCMTSEARLQSSGEGAEYRAYCEWAASFGLDSPEACFKQAGDEVALAWEGAVKVLVAGHALGLALEQEVGAKSESEAEREATDDSSASEGLVSAPSRRHLQTLLHVCFQLERKGNVYSEENRAAVSAALPESLVLSDCEAAKQRLLHPSPASSDRLALLANRLLTR